MVTKKKVVTKKTASVKSVAVSKASTMGNKKLHIVLGDTLMAKFERKCKKLGMSKSEIGRILIEYFVKNDMEVTPPSVTSTKLK